MTRGEQRRPLRSPKGTEELHYWTVDPDAERIECLRLEGGRYRLVAEASTPEPLAHPDWPGLGIDLADLWR